MPDAAIFSRPLPGARFVEVRTADSLLTIAMRELGDAGRWTELAALNGLRHPYIAAVPGEGVVVPGALIKVPAPSGYVTADADAAQVFRADVALEGGRIHAAGGDFAVVSGNANLRQALGIRIMVDQQELLFHPEYGCRVRRLLGKGGGPASALLAQQYIKSALRADDRVAGVPEVKAEIQGDRISVSATAEAVGGVVVNVSGVV